MKAQKNKSGSYWRLCTRTLTMALLSLLVFNIHGWAQSCVQLGGQTYYSRVINGTFLNNGFLSADYDATNQNLYIASTDNGSGVDNPYLAEVHYNSVINWSEQYSLTGNEITMA